MPTKKKKTEIKEIAYRKYQLSWLTAYGLGVPDIEKLAEDWQIEREAGDFDDGFGDYLFERGFHGSLWVCFEEFLENEYLDKEYMKDILSLDEYKEYLAERELDDKPKEPAQSGIVYVIMGEEGLETVVPMRIICSGRSGDKVFYTMANEKVSSLACYDSGDFGSKVFLDPKEAQEAVKSLL